MPNVTIRGLPDHVYEIMKKRAAENRRSLNQELVVTIEQIALTPATGAKDQLLTDLNRIHSRFGSARFTAKEIKEGFQRGRK